MRAKQWLSVITVLIMLCCSACSNKYIEQFEKSGSDLGSRDPSDYKERKLYGFQHQHVNDHHQMKTMKFSPEAAKTLIDMKGIHLAYVILTDRNAYIAIALNNTATGFSGRGNVTQLNNIGKSHGIYDPLTDRTYPDPNTAYSIQDPKDISSKLKQNIAKKIKSIHPEVSEIFISANRDFFNIVNGYYIRSLRGHNLNEFVPEFKNIVSKHFVE